MTDRLITYRELSQWLARGNGEVKVGISISTLETRKKRSENTVLQGMLF